MSATRRATHELGNLLEGQSAPQVSDDHLALFRGQLLQRRRRRSDVQRRVALALRREPTGLAAGCVFLVALTPLGRAGGAEGAIADNAVKPGHRMGRWRVFPTEFD